MLSTQLSIARKEEMQRADASLLPVVLHESTVEAVCLVLRPRDRGVVDIEVLCRWAGAEPLGFGEHANGEIHIWWCLVAFEASKRSFS